MCNIFEYGERSSVGRAPDCGSGCRGFEPHRSPHKGCFIMLIVISGFPAAFINILFTSSLLIEVIFSLDGLGLLGFEAALGRDSPGVFGRLYIFTLIGLLLRLISDLTYVLIDPRIDFESRGN